MTEVGGRSEWGFATAPTSSVPTTLEQAIASLPTGIGAKKAAQLLHDQHPTLQFTTREVRDAIGALTLAENPPVPVRNQLAAMLAEGSAAGVPTRLDALAKDFVIRRAGVNGLGAYATRSIKRGERVLAEAPLVEWTIRSGETVAEAGINKLVADLGQADRDDYFGLC